MPTFRDLSRVSISDLSQLTGCTRETCAKRLRESSVGPIGGNGRSQFYDPKLALPVVLGVAGDALSPQRERAALDRARRLEVERRLVDAEGEIQQSIDRVVVAFAKVVRDRILSVPSATFPEIASRTTPEIARSIGYVVDRHLRAALVDLADEGDRELFRHEGEHSGEPEP